MKPLLTEADFEKAAIQLRTGVAEIKTVASVESAGKGFQTDGSPRILFERHKFHKYSGGKFSALHPDISNRNPGGYSKNSEGEHLRMAKAASLNRDAALMSASWGKFQVLGKNWEALCYPSLQDFVNDMYESEGKHLESFVRFVIVNKLDDELRTHNWAGFAAGYNGSNYAINKYDKKLAEAYAKFSKK